MSQQNYISNAFVI